MTFCTHRCGRIDWTLDKTWKVWYENIPSTGFDFRNWVTKLGPTTPKDWGLLQSPGATLWKKQAASWVAKSINLHTLVKQCQVQVGGRIHRAFAAGQVYAWPILQALGVGFYRFNMFQPSAAWKTTWRWWSSNTSCVPHALPAGFVSEQFGRPGNT